MTTKITVNAYYSSLPSRANLAANPVSKGELATRLFPETSYDTALPQSWLDDAVAATGMDYGQLLSSVVYLYPPSHLFGIPAALTRHAFAQLQGVGFTQWEGEQ